MGGISTRRATGERKLRVCFFFNAQRHQMLHGIGTAFRLARNPRFEVTVMSPSQAHLDYARWLCRKWGEDRIVYSCPDSPVLRAAWRKAGGAVPPKILTLTVLAPLLRRFDAIALPERTSIALKWLGVRSASFVHIDHGAGDRAAGFDRRIAKFDFVLMAGEKHRARLMREGLIRDGDHAIVGYPKFEAADAARDDRWSPFPGDDRPIVLYNPHFSSLGSWHTMAERVLKAFAEQDRYNLIVAPHVRLFDQPTARDRWRPLLDRYAGHLRIHIDTGSDRSIDMTYTTIADIYLGDVSSQVYEFLRTPRPCLFLDAAGIDWQTDENYAHWHFGPVTRDIDRLIEAVDAARTEHPAFRQRQVEGFAETFSVDDRLPSECAAEAIAAHVVQRSRPVTARHGERRWTFEPRFRRAATLAKRAAVIAPAVLGGWLLHDFAQPSSAVASNSFVDEAVASHEVLLLRDIMRSQPEARDFEPGEIRAATGITMPRLPAGWHVHDVQVFPSAYGPSVQLLVEAAPHDRFSMVVMRRNDTPAERKPLMERRSGENVVYWEQGDIAVGLVSRGSPERLLRMASEVIYR